MRARTHTHIKCLLPNSQGGKKNLPCFSHLNLLLYFISSEESYKKKKIALKSLNHKNEAYLLIWHTKEIRVIIVTIIIDYHLLNGFVVPLTISAYTKQQGRNSYPQFM